MKKQNNTAINFAKLQMYFYTIYSLVQAIFEATNSYKFISISIVEINKHLYDERNIYIKYNIIAD